MAKKSIRLETLHSAFEENGIPPDTIELNGSLIHEISGSGMNCHWIMRTK